MAQSNDVTDIESLPALPEPISIRRACEQCELLPVCASYHRVNSSNNASPAPTAFKDEIVPRATAHLTPAHLDFYRRMSTNLLLETGEVRKASRLKMLWKELPTTREAKRSAISNLTLKQVNPEHSHRFVRTITVISTSTLHVGESVIVSTDVCLALAQGHIVSVTKDEVVVQLDKDILQESLTEPKCDKMEFIHTVNLQHHLAIFQDSEIKYHLDRYEYNMASLFSSQSSNFVNLAKMMLDNPQAAKLRDLVVDKRPATFVTTLNKEFAVIAKHILRPLNTVQQKAVFKTLMANDYVLLEGMPGTGKTTVIVAFIRLLMVLGKSVLLTAYTHSAVDNVLLKLMGTAKQGEKSLDFLRIGKQSRIHPKLAHATFQAKVLGRGDPAVTQEAIQDFSLVATTCLGKFAAYVVTFDKYILVILA